MERRRLFDFRYIPQERRRGNRIGAAVVLAAIAVYFLISRYGFSVGRVTDVSMQPTLEPGRLFLVQRYVYRLRIPRRGELVVFRAPGHPRWLYVKRVAAVAGEEISFSAGKVVVNGRPMEEPYVKGETHPERPPVRIPAGFVFVLGDNRTESEDSRHFGAVPVRELVGKI